jgi:hypothetical protein
MGVRGMWPLFRPSARVSSDVPRGSRIRIGKQMLPTWKVGGGLMVVICVSPMNQRQSRWWSMVSRVLVVDQRQRK